MLHDVSKLYGLVRFDLFHPRTNASAMLEESERIERLRVANYIANTCAERERNMAARPANSSDEYFEANY